MPSAFPTAAQRNRVTDGQRKLTDEQVREIRLSMDSADVASRRYRVHHRTITNVRQGSAYGPVAPDEARAHIARARDANRTSTTINGKLVDTRQITDPVSYIVVGPLFPGAGLADQDRQEQKDAAHECRHGALPHDRVIRCDCWAATPLPVAERAPVVTSSARWTPERRKWRAGVCIDGQPYNVGLYDTPEAAEDGIRTFIAAKTNPTPGGINVNGNHRERVERFRQQASVDGHGRPADDRAVLA